MNCRTFPKILAHEEKATTTATTHVCQTVQSGTSILLTNYSDCVSLSVDEQSYCWLPTPIMHVKCVQTNKRRIVDYPNTWAFVRDIYQLPGVAETVDQEHIMQHYFVSICRDHCNTLVSFSWSRPGYTFSLVTLAKLIIKGKATCWLKPPWAAQYFAIHSFVPHHSLQW